MSSTTTALKYRVDLRFYGACPFVFEQLDLFYVDKLSDVEYYLEKYCSDFDKSVNVNITIELTDRKLWQEYHEKEIQKWRDKNEK